MHAPPSPTLAEDLSVLQGRAAQGVESTSNSFVAQQDTVTLTAKAWGRGLWCWL